MALISVILPVFNGEKYIKEAIYSILDQTISDFELYVIDDGSTDGTVSLIEEIVDSRINLVLNQTNKGLIYSLNRGLELVKDCEFIARMDADDISMPNRFAEQIDFFRENQSVGLLGSSMQYFSTEDRNEKIVHRPETNSEILSTFMFYNPIFHPTVMIRFSILEADERYPLDFPKNEDHAFWINLIRNTKFSNLNKVLLKYRRHSSNVTNTYKNNIEEDFKVNQLLLSRFCSSWNIELNENQSTILGIISYQERHRLKRTYSSSELIENLDQLLPKLPVDFDLQYFKNVYCDRCIQYFFKLKRFKELTKFMFFYKYDKFFLLRYLILGKK